MPKNKPLMPPVDDGKRTLTDADIAAIVAQAESAFVARFYSDLGRGVWGILWKALLMAALGIAAYGGYKGIK